MSTMTETTLEQKRTLRDLDRWTDRLEETDGLVHDDILESATREALRLIISIENPNDNTNYYATE